MKKAWAKVFNKFEDAERFKQEYYLLMSPEERLNAVQFCREQFYKMKKGPGNKDGKRLRGVIRIINQK